MGWDNYGGYGWGEYVSVGQKIANGVRAAAELAKRQNRKPSPVTLKSKKITTTFWGNAWCKNLEAYSDYASRLPRGATYVRNGSVADLVIKPLRVEAVVAGSEAYTVSIEISALSPATWKQIKRECSQEIDSLLDLLAGRFSEGVMKRLTRQKEGLFPAPSEIKMRCSCPDGAWVCKHLAAVMYGVGARLDSQPELLFLLRDVDHQELVSQAVAEGNLERELTATASAFDGEDLGAMFGIELDLEPTAASPTKTKKAGATKKKATSKKKATAKKKTATKKVAPKKAAVKKAATKKKSSTKR